MTNLFIVLFDIENIDVAAAVYTDESSPFANERFERIASLSIDFPMAVE